MRAARGSSRRRLKRSDQPIANRFGAMGFLCRFPSGASPAPEEALDRLRLARCDQLTRDALVALQPRIIRGFLTPKTQAQCRKTAVHAGKTADLAASNTQNDANSRQSVTNAAARVAGAACFWQDGRRNVAEAAAVAQRACKRADQGSRGRNSMIIGLIVLSGLLSLVYGGVTVSQVMAAAAGSQNMQEISGAVAEGAQAYLQTPIYDHRGRRHRRLHRPRPAAVLGRRDRLPDRRDPLGRRRLHRHERLGARQRAHGAGGDQVARRAASTSPSRRARSPACWWPASRCSASPAISGS